VKDLALVSNDVSDPSVDLHTELGGCGRGSHPDSFLINFEFNKQREILKIDI
jgi:hypothetical protein